MKAHFWDLLTPRERKFVAWIVGLLLVYAVVGFLILPPIVRNVAVKQISEQLDRKVSIDQVKINPFTFAVTIRGLLIKDKDGQPFVSWDRLYANLQLSSFFGHAWVFEEISATKPYVRVQMNKDRTFNFTDIINKFASNSPPASAAAKRSPAVAVYVGRLRIGGAEVALTDFTPREPFKRVVGPFNINLDDFRTDPGNKNPYTFSGTTDAGERISWNGFFSLSPLRSEGELRLFNFTVNEYAPLYEDLVRFQVRAGKIAMDVKYRVEFSATNRVAMLDNFSYELRDFKFALPDDSNSIVEVPLFSLTGANVDLQGHSATVDWVQLKGAKAYLARDTNAQVNVVEMSRPPASAVNAPGGILLLLRSVTNAVTMLLNSTNEWTGTVRTIEATNCELHLVDRANPRTARLDLTDITLDARNLSNLAGTNLYADFSLRWNTNGSLRIGANVAFQPTTADINLDFDRLDLRTLDAYLASKVDLFVLGSEVNLHGTVRLRPDVNSLPVVSFRGDTSLDNFHTVDGVYGEDLLNWDVLSFNGIVANLNPPLVAMDEIVVEGAYARLIVETNHTINLENVLKPPGTAPVVTNQIHMASAPRAVQKSATTNAGTAPFEFSVQTVYLTNSTVRFSDRSMQPNVNLDLQSVNGTISGISSEEMQHAVVNLNAKVDGAGPVTITGLINPVSAGQTNTLTISVKDVDLTAASPYAAKFAGYDIAEGKLNLDLNYQLVGKRISAKNVITLDQFTFGDAVNSPDATHLPVRLAIAILKDRQGKIVLDVPVEGSLDDPKFRISKVVTRAIVNILEKVATSPFSLLGAAFGGGGEDMGWQDFAPASAELTATDRQKLDTLAKALYDRPALKLEIAGSVDAEADRQGLQRAALDSEIRHRKWTKLRRSEQATNSVDKLVLTDADRAHYIPKFYTEAMSAHKITPELVAADTNLAAFVSATMPRSSAVRKGAMGLMRLGNAKENTAGAARQYSRLEPPPTPQEAVLMATFPVSDADLATLAAARAQTVENYLLQSGEVDAGRIFLTARGAENVRKDGTRAYLQFR